ncbi:MAG: hypothetical protein JST39_02885 [Bacteroidetes bacterium]|nr:hypothetical protein [Bacteroidota bacterium]
MKHIFRCSIVLFSVVLQSCSGKPSEKEIVKKMLMEYTCAEQAKVNNLKIISTEETTNMMGGKAWRYKVTGEVQWPEGCADFGSRLQPGYTQPFEKTVYLSKGEDGNWY